MLAVLEDAIRTLLLARRTAVSRKRLSGELAWVQSTSHAEPFAFESICDVLGVDPSYLRARFLLGSFVPVAAARAAVPRSGIRRADPEGPRSCSASY